MLAASLLIPTVRAYADDDSPGNHRQREALREDQRELAQLRDLCRREIRDKKRKIWQDRRDIYEKIVTGYDRNGRYEWRYGKRERYEYRDRHYDRD